MPGGDVPSLRQPAGTGIGGQGLYLPESWTSDPGRCAAAGVPKERGNYRSKTELNWSDICRGRRLRDVAVLPGGLGGPGDALRAGRSGQHSGLALGAFVEVRTPGAPASPGWRTAADHGSAVTSGGGLAGDNSGPGKPGAAELYVRRPAGAGNPEGQAGPGGMGCLPPEPAAASPATTCPTALERRG